MGGGVRPRQARRRAVAGRSFGAISSHGMERLSGAQARVGGSECQESQTRRGRPQYMAGVPPVIRPGHFQTRRKSCRSWAARRVIVSIQVPKGGQSDEKEPQAPPAGGGWSGRGGADRVLEF